MKISIGILVMFLITSCASWEQERERKEAGFYESLGNTENHYRELEEHTASDIEAEVSQPGVEQIKAKITSLRSFAEKHQILCDKGDEIACKYVDRYKVRVTASAAAYKTAEENVNRKKAEKQVEQSERERLEKEKSAESQRYFQARSASGEEDLEHVCAGQITLERTNKIIAHEKSIGAKHGVVNKQALYQAGQQQIFAKRLLADHKPLFEKKSGKKFHRSLCNFKSEEDESQGEDPQRNACTALKSIKHYEDKISEQREIEKTSGVVDMSVLHKYGSILEGTKDILSKAKAKIKKSTGKDFDPSGCEK